jgi:hypothetical protein
MRCCCRALCVFVCLAGFSGAESTSEVQRAIDEFKIQTANLGLRADSPVKSAPARNLLRDWHGRLYENFRNDFLDAVPHEIVQNGGDKGVLRRNQYGFNIGGPFFVPGLTHGKSNTYISLSFESVHERISRASLHTIPTMDERTGDYSHTVDEAGDPLIIYDPNSTRPNPAYNPSQPVSVTNLQYLRDPFPGNLIPVDRLNPVALAALKLYPAPNAAIGPFFQNNYFVDSPEVNGASGMIGKVDHSIGERQRISTELAFSDGVLDPAPVFNTIANPGSPNQDFSSRRGSLSYVYTVSAQTVNTATLEANSITTRGGSQNQPAFPVYQFDPYVSMGQSYPVSSGANNTYTFSDGISMRFGQHSVRVIGQYTKYQVNSFWPQYPDGIYQFDAGLTSLPGIIDTGEAFASFMLGLPAFAEQSFVASPSYFRRSEASVALRDHYEPRKGLAVDIGVNMVRHTPRVEKYGRQSTIDFSMINPENGLPGALAIANQDGELPGFRPTLYRAEPSLGIAWNLTRDSKTVLRAGYSRGYSAIPIYQGQWGTQGFTARQTFLSPDTQLQPAVPLTPTLPALANPLPNLSPDAANNTVADLVDSTDREPVYQSASLTVERELPGSMVLSLGAGYSGGHNLLVGDGAANPNAISPADLSFGDQLNNLAFASSLRPYPQYQGFELDGLYPIGRYQRDAGTVRLEKRASMGLSVSAYYEFSKQMDDYSGPYGVQDYFNRQNDWSLTSYNQPQRLQVSYNYELPLGANKTFLTYSDWRHYLVDGWSLSGTASVMAGTPIALRPEFNNTGGVVSALTVNVVPGVNPQVSNPGPTQWFNPGAFDQPADFTLGDASRTSSILSNPGTQNYDLSVNKRMALGAETAVELNATGFNFLNHANWNDPDPVIGPASAPNLDAGKIIGSRGGRVVQLGLRLSF